ncbi:hypothetical protein [Pantoea sp.]|uniref:hypothetical protein n=1 Tax=Pantoea sp. TaxID=69393 RepID=UPI002899A2B0|nr:hypothetical protein [Pantoea sp.]
MQGKMTQRSGLLFSLTHIILHIALGIAAIIISFFCTLLHYASNLTGACVFILIFLYFFCLFW